MKKQSNNCLSLAYQASQTLTLSKAIQIKAGLIVWDEAEKAYWVPGPAIIAETDKHTALNPPGLFCPAVFICRRQGIDWKDVSPENTIDLQAAIRAGQHRLYTLPFQRTIEYAVRWPFAPAALIVTIPQHSTESFYRSFQAVLVPDAPKEAPITLEVSDVDRQRDGDATWMTIEHKGKTYRFEERLQGQAHTHPSQRTAIVTINKQPASLLSREDKNKLMDQGRVPMVPALTKPIPVFCPYIQTP